MVIPTVIRALETVPETLIRVLEELEIEGRTKTVQAKTLLRGGVY